MTDWKALCAPFCGPIAPAGTCRPGEVRLEGLAKEAVETSRTRLLVMSGMFLLAFAAIAVRLVDVSGTGVGGANLVREGDEPTTGPTNGAPPRFERAEIIDRNGVVLATNIPTYSLFADPALVVDADKVASQLVTLFPDLDRDATVRRLSAERRFIWLRRHITPTEYQAVINLGLAGLGVRRDSRRVYPQGRLSAHLLGYTDVDNRGLGGVERHFDTKLRDTGEPLRLSLDVRVQEILRNALATAVREYRAIGASGIVLDVRTGEVVAMVSLPDFDPHAPTAAAEHRFNRNTLGVYEMGSTFKVLNTAMALDSGRISLDDRFDVRQPIRVASFTIRDYYPLNRRANVADIFIHSSNIGSARMAEALGGPAQKRFLERLGLLRPASVELPEVGAPLSPATWRPINTLTISYGHGVAVTPMQFATAVAGIVNDGIMVPPTVVSREGRIPPGTQVVSVRTSLAIRSLMRQVVVKGTGTRAEAEGYLVGGKTGTADKPGTRGYNSRRIMSSFVATFPVSSPRYVVLAILDEPKGTAETQNRATGGWVAAPIVRRVVEEAAPLLGVLPNPSTDEPDLLTARAPGGRGNPLRADRE